MAETFHEYDFPDDRSVHWHALAAELREGAVTTPVADAVTCSGCREWLAIPPPVEQGISLADYEAQCDAGWLKPGEITADEALAALGAWCAAAPPMTRRVSLEKSFVTRAHCWRVTLTEEKKRPEIGVGTTPLAALLDALRGETDLGVTPLARVGGPTVFMACVHPPGSRTCSVCTLDDADETSEQAVSARALKSRRYSASNASAFPGGDVVGEFLQEERKLLSTIKLPSLVRGWSQEDPRHGIDKRDRVIILRPSLSGKGWVAGTGEVETHQGYSITTSFDDHAVIGADDIWDPSWAWILEATRS